MKTLLRLLAGRAAWIAAVVAWPASAFAGFCPNVVNCTGGSISIATIALIGAGLTILLVLPDPGGLNPDDLGNKTESAGDFAEDILNAMREFEELQRDLKRETDGVLERLGDFNDQYNARFQEALSDLNLYAKTYQKLVPDIQEILDTASDHQLGRKIADWSDKAIAAVGMVGGLGEGLLGGAEVENAAAAAAREAEVASQAERLAAKEAAAEAGAARGAAREAKAASQAERMAENEGAAAGGGKPLKVEEFTPEDAGYPPAKPAAPEKPGAVPTEQAVETTKAGSQAESPAAKLSGQQRDVAEALAEDKLKDILKPIKGGAGKDQCTHASEAFAKSWQSGRQNVIDPAAPLEGRTRPQMESLFGGKYTDLGDDPSAAIQQIKQALEAQGPGSQALISVRRLTAVGEDAGGVTNLGPVAHSFNAVNVDGFVKFVDVGEPGVIVREKALGTNFGWKMMGLQ